MKPGKSIAKVCIYGAIPKGVGKVFFPAAWPVPLRVNTGKRLSSLLPLIKFENFVRIYNEDMKHRLREHTYVQKQYVIDKKLLPFFGKLPVSQITPANVRKWQNKLMAYRDDNGKAYSETYLRTINNQLTNHELCGPVLQLKRKSLQKGRKHWKRPRRRDAVLDNGGIRACEEISVNVNLL